MLPTPAAPHAAEPGMPKNELGMSLLLCLGLWAALAVAQASAAVPLWGPAVAAATAYGQLRAPLWRMECWGRELDALGLTTRAWRQDARTVAWLIVLTWPLYAVGHHLWMTGYGLPAALHPAGPPLRFAVQMPHGALAWCRATGWFVERALTHGLGVALPEELFYRGYLQQVWQRAWPPQRTVAAAPLGAAAVAATAAFALGHIVGTWQPARLGPFFPGLLFAWQRNRSGTILGSVSLHGLCNLFGEVLARLYRT